MLRFSDQIQAAYRAAVRSGTLAGAEPLISVIGDFNAPPEQHDAAWAALLKAYSEGSRQAWAAAVLEAVRIDLVVAIVAMPALPPVIGRDDIAQALIAETLDAALEGPTLPARWTRHRLITRATTAVERWLADEIRRLGWVEVPTENHAAEESEATRTFRELLVDIEAGRLPARAVVMVYREEVLGESREELAAEAGVSIDAIRKRRERAIKAIRARLAA